MEKGLINLYEEYKAYCAKESKKLAKDKKADYNYMPMTFDGFFEWLKTREEAKS